MCPSMKTHLVSFLLINYFDDSSTINAGGAGGKMANWDRIDNAPVDVSLKSNSHENDLHTHRIASFFFGVGGGQGRTALWMISSNSSSHSVSWIQIKKELESWW